MTKHFHSSFTAARGEDTTAPRLEPPPFLEIGMSRAKFKPHPRGNLDRVRMLENEVHRLRTENESLKQKAKALADELEKAGR